jgi:hypothetical protein
MLVSDATNLVSEQVNGVNAYRYDRLTTDDDAREHRSRRDRRGW